MKYDLEEEEDGIYNLSKKDKSDKEDLFDKDYELYFNYPYTYPSFTMIGFFERLFRIKSKYYKENNKNK